MKYKSKNHIIFIIDLCAMLISFIIAYVIRFSYWTEIEEMQVVAGKELIVLYFEFFCAAFALYALVVYFKGRIRLERQSYGEILLAVTKEQFLFIIVFVLCVFIFHKTYFISRFVVGFILAGNIILDSVGRIAYHEYCVHGGIKPKKSPNTPDGKNDLNEEKKGEKQHVYIIGSKSIGLYGGFESFVMNLLKQHEDNEKIQYHVACKANGSGYMDLSKLPEAVQINDHEFSYCSAHCFLIDVNEKLGSAQAIDYDIKALKWCCKHIEKNHISTPIVYILASRIGPFEKKYVQQIHEAGGRVFQNPDGHEDWRRKWSPFVRRYWKFSEQFAIKNADLVVCDSINIENYIKDEYSVYEPQTTYVPYGSYIKTSHLANDDPKYTSWLAAHDLKDGQFYISVGRFVPENNIEVMIREFMASKTTRDFALITTEDVKYLEQLQQKLNFKNDKRIKFVGTVYDQELLRKIRERAYGYFHGHEVGGTNPSLLESLGSTKLNLLYDVCFNKEVAADAALYWSKEEHDLANLLDRVEAMGEEEIESLSHRAQKRILDHYSWEKIADMYRTLFCENA